MRWILLGIVGYVSLVIQAAVFRPGGLAVPIDGHWTRPDLVLIVALFIALYFQPRDVFIATWCLGLGADLVSVSGRLGVQALMRVALLIIALSLPCWVGAADRTYSIKSTMRTYIVADTHRRHSVATRR